MRPERVYLDYNALAPVRPEARDALVRSLGLGGNPSSVHDEGRSARQTVERARAAIARSIGAKPDNVTFTAGATEANATVLTPEWRDFDQTVSFEALLVGATEHPSVLAGGRFDPDRIETLPVDRNGCLDFAALDKRLAAVGGPVLVSVMLANNETGTINDIRAIADRVHDSGGFLHTDAVQALGRLSVDMEALGADSISVSAHKIGAIAGAGAIVTRPGIAIPALVHGGGQEGYRRAGTENVGAIAAFGAVLEGIDGLNAENARIRSLRDWLARKLAHISEDLIVFGDTVNRLPNTICFAVPGVKAETAMIAFDLDGIAVSSGSACSSGKVAASHVLAAMGVDPTDAAGAIRVSLGWSTTEKDIERFLQSFQKLCKNHRPQGQTKAA
ncbi:MAG: cysteine desulfurase family protein [Pseudomonadota bacterium]